LAINTTYTQARINLAELLDKVVQDQETVVIARRGKADNVAMVGESELASLRETVHLLSSARNAERLLGALQRARKGGGETMTIEELKRQAGLVSEG